MRLYFFITAQIARVAKPMLFNLGILGSSKEI